jgi:hypothetical protein
MCAKVPEVVKPRSGSAIPSCKIKVELKKEADIYTYIAAYGQNNQNQ